MCWRSLCHQNLRHRFARRGKPFVFHSCKWIRFRPVHLGEGISFRSPLRSTPPLIRHCGRWREFRTRLGCLHWLANHSKDDNAASPRRLFRFKRSAQKYPRVQTKTSCCPGINPCPRVLALPTLNDAPWTKVELLEDIQFLVRHAGVIMPSNPEEITGLGVESSMLSLQNDMTDARQR